MRTHAWGLIGREKRSPEGWLSSSNQGIHVSASVPVLVS